MKLINSREENGYIINEYSNGTIEKYLKSLEIEKVVQNQQLSEQEIVNAQILNQLDYLTCLQELNGMKGGNL